MKALNLALLAHLSHSAMTLFPVWLLTYWSESWTHWIVNLLGAFFIPGIVLRQFHNGLSTNRLVSQNAGAYISAMPFFAAWMWLDPGPMETTARVIFSIINAACFVISWSEHRLFLADSGARNQ